jgi:hypothetical protein
MSPCVTPELTRRTRDLPTFTQQVNIFSAIHITQKCFTIYKNIPSMIIPVVNQINPVDLLTSYVSKIHFNVIPSWTARSHTQERRDATTEEGIERSKERIKVNFVFPIVPCVRLMVIVS